MTKKRINNSTKYTNFSQRNNEYQGNCACNVTSIIMMDIYNGIITFDDNGLPYGPNGFNIYSKNSKSLPEIPYRQIEDNLIYFMQHDVRVIDYYKKTYPDLYKAWKKDLEKNRVRFKDSPDYENISKYVFNNSYPPNQLHFILAYANGLFVGKHGVTQYRNTNINKILDILESGKSMAISGKFGNLNHVVCLVGANYTVDLSTGTRNVESLVVDDPWGETYAYYKMKSGNDIVIPWDKFQRDIKPLESNSIFAIHVEV